MVLVDLGPRGIDAARAEARLEAANIALNALSPALLRIGTPAVTTRGFADREIALVCGWIAELLERPADAAAVAAVREQVLALCREFPIYAR
jgi:glycine hydroxymethyltransferase